MNKILITGVHTGLGNALAKAGLDNGDFVTGISRTEPTDLISYERFTFHAVDLAQLSTLKETLTNTLMQTGGFDLVILNAGILGEINRMEDLDVHEMKKVMDVNVWANKILLDVSMKTAPPKQVIGISSGAAIYGSCGWGAYSISKAALNTLIRVFADENPMCHCTALAPGLVNTNMLQSIFEMPPNPDFPGDVRLREARDEGRVQSSEETAKLILSITDKLKAVKSGSYLDIRDLPFEID